MATAERAGLRGGPRSFPRRLVVEAARERHACAPRPVTRSGMDSGSVAGERPKRTPGRQRLLPSGYGGPERPGVSPPPGGRSWPRPRGRAARASPLLLLLLVPSPRLAATAPRRTLAERSLPGHAVPAAALGAGRNAPGRRLLGGRVAALAGSRRGEAGGSAGHPGDGALPTPGRRFGARSPGGWAPADANTRVCPGTPVGAGEKGWSEGRRSGGDEGMASRFDSGLYSFTPGPLSPMSVKSGTLLAVWGNSAKHFLSGAYFMQDVQHGRVCFVYVYALIHTNFTCTNLTNTVEENRRYA